MHRRDTDVDADVDADLAQPMKIRPLTMIRAPLPLCTLFRDRAIG